MLLSSGLSAPEPAGAVRAPVASRRRARAARSRRACGRPTRSSRPDHGHQPQTDCRARCPATRTSRRRGRPTARRIDQPGRSGPAAAPGPSGLFTSPHLRLPADAQPTSVTQMPALSTLPLAIVRAALIWSIVPRALRLYGWTAIPSKLAAMSGTV